MKKHLKRLLSLMMAVLLCIGVMPSSAFAASYDYDGYISMIDHNTRGYGGGILVRAVHGVSHDFMPDPILIYYHNRFFPVQVGKALVMVQMPFIPFGDPPEDTVHIASFFRQDSGDAIPAAVHAKGKAVPFQPDGIHHFRIGAAEGHLV